MLCGPTENVKLRECQFGGTESGSRTGSCKGFRISPCLPRGKGTGISMSFPFMFGHETFVR